MIHGALRAAALLLACSLSGGVRATDFLRGDANNDGVVSMADAYAVSNFLFHQGDLTCGSAADATDTSGVDIVDIARIMGYVLGRSDPPPSPFPTVGPDPTPDDTQLPQVPPGCDSYGGSTVLDDPSFRLEVIDAASNGGGDGSAYILIALANTAHLTAFGGSCQFPPGLVTGVAPGNEEANPLIPGTQFFTSFAEDRMTVFVQSPYWDEVTDIAPSPLTPAVELRVCLAQGTAAGEYPMTLEWGELVELETSRSIRPSLGSLPLNVLADVTVSQDCEDAPPPTPPPVNAAFGLVAGPAPPGGAVDVTFTIRTDAEVQGFVASIDFDEEVLHAVSAEPIWRKPDGTDYSFYRFEYSNENNTPGNAGVDEGFLISIAIFDFFLPVGLPVDTDNEVTRFHMTVRPETTALSTELRFVDGAQGSGQPARNSVTANGDNDYTEDSPGSFIFVNGLIGIAPDIITFLRADSNGDAKVDLSDAQTTLASLFLGAERVACFDAADANDDGKIDISDPISTLQFLFQGGPSPASPYPDPGEDPTQDPMGCLYRDS